MLYLHDTTEQTENSKCLKGPALKMCYFHRPPLMLLSKLWSSQLLNDNAAIYNDRLYLVQSINKNEITR